METAEPDGPQTVAIGNALLTLPHSWSVASRSGAGIVVRSATGREQATISVIAFNKPVSFDEFCRVCQQRVEAERKGLKDGFIHPDPTAPRNASDGFSLFYMGGDKSTHRVFSAYLIQIDSQVLTVYLESFGIALTEHSETFRSMLSTLRRRKRLQAESQQDEPDRV